MELFNRPCLRILNDYVLIVSIILLSGSLYYTTYGKNNLLFILLAWGSALVYFNRVAIDIKLWAYAALIVVIMAINPGLLFSHFLLTIGLLATAILICSYMKFEKFAELYFNIFMFICCFSWLGLFVIKLSFQSPLSYFISDANELYDNFIVFAVPVNNFVHSIQRISSLWWEPGAFAVLVDLAFLFSLITKKIRPVSFVILLLSILMIQSTTGIIVFAVFCLFGFSIWEAKKTYKVGALILLLILAAVIIQQPIFYKVLIVKFQKGSGNYVSFQARYNDLLVDWDLFKNNLFIGVGWGNLQARLNMAYQLLGQVETGPAAPPLANLISSILGQLGLLGLVLLKPLLWPAYLKEFSWWQRILLSLGLIILFSSENFGSFIIIWLLIIYGINFRHHSQSPTCAYKVAV
jgi:hypothetical protein